MRYPILYRGAIQGDREPVMFPCVYSVCCVYSVGITLSVHLPNPFPFPFFSLLPFSPLPTLSPSSLPLLTSSSLPLPSSSFLSPLSSPSPSSFSLPPLRSSVSYSLHLLSPLLPPHFPSLSSFSPPLPVLPLPLPSFPPPSTSFPSSISSSTSFSSILPAPPASLFSSLSSSPPPSTLSIPPSPPSSSPPLLSLILPSPALLLRSFSSILPALSAPPVFSLHPPRSTPSTSSWHSEGGIRESGRRPPPSLPSHSPSSSRSSALLLPILPHSTSSGLGRGIREGHQGVRTRPPPITSRHFDWGIPSLSLLSPPSPRSPSSSPFLPLLPLPLSPSSISFSSSSPLLSLLPPLLLPPSSRSSPLLPPPPSPSILPTFHLPLDILLAPRKGASGSPDQASSITSRHFDWGNSLSLSPYLLPLPRSPSFLSFLPPLPLLFPPSSPPPSRPLHLPPSSRSSRPSFSLHPPHIPPPPRHPPGISEGGIRESGPGLLPPPPSPSILPALLLPPSSPTFHLPLDILLASRKGASGSPGPGLLFSFLPPPSPLILPLLPPPLLPPSSPTFHLPLDILLALGGGIRESGPGLLPPLLPHPPAPLLPPPPHIPPPPRHPPGISEGGIRGVGPGLLRCTSRHFRLGEFPLSLFLSPPLSSFFLFSAISFPSPSTFSSSSRSAPSPAPHLYLPVSALSPHPRPTFTSPSNLLAISEGASGVRTRPLSPTSPSSSASPSLHPPHIPPPPDMPACIWKGGIRLVRTGSRSRLQAFSIVPFSRHPPAPLPLCPPSFLPPCLHIPLPRHLWILGRGHQGGRGRRLLRSPPEHFDLGEFPALSLLICSSPLVSPSSLSASSFSLYPFPLLNLSLHLPPPPFSLHLPSPPSFSPSSATFPPARHPPGISDGGSGSPDQALRRLRPILPHPLALLPPLTSPPSSPCSSAPILLLILPHSALPRHLWHLGRGAIRESGQALLRSPLLHHPPHIPPPLGQISGTIEGGIREESGPGLLRSPPGIFDWGNSILPVFPPLLLPPSPHIPPPPRTPLPPRISEGSSRLLLLHPPPHSPPRHPPGISEGGIRESGPQVLPPLLSPSPVSAALLLLLLAAPSPPSSAPLLPPSSPHSSLPRHPPGISEGGIREPRPSHCLSPLLFRSRESRGRPVTTVAEPARSPREREGAEEGTGSELHLLQSLPAPRIQRTAPSHPTHSSLLRQYSFTFILLALLPSFLLLSPSLFPPPLPDSSASLFPLPFTSRCFPSLPRPRPFFSSLDLPSPSFFSIPFLPFPAFLSFPLLLRPSLLHIRSFFISPHFSSWHLSLAPPDRRLQERALRLDPSPHRPPPRELKTTSRAGGFPQISVSCS
ncbi:hypothetical protein C7M84_011060 [Penaeus vannamei]|uniref:Uncharacterized protein n=1 Tax=Penaeus vannamei TaxID=6689 RepID=A0A423T2L8_PENVA|nr:hypothetical protein C7M84_011060 [Penaeus vannamei]